MQLNRIEEISLLGDKCSFNLLCSDVKYVISVKEERCKRQLNVNVILVLDIVVLRAL